MRGNSHNASVERGRAFLDRARGIGAEQNEHIVDPPGNPLPNAERFVAAHFYDQQHRRLVYHGGEWYEWDETCWPVLEERQLRAQLYDYFGAAVYSHDDDLKNFAPTKRKIDDLMDALRAIAHLPVVTTSPCWLAGAPDVPATEFVACANGLIHVPTRVLHPHTPTYYGHHAVAFGFDPAPRAPKRWLGFLRELWGDDTESIATLQELFGYLVSSDTRKQKLFLIVGPKRSGKGTIARVLTAMLGHHNVAGPTLAGLATNFGLSPLIGKPAAIISDARLGHKTDSSIVTERLLSISGEDMLTIDRKYRDPWSGQLPTRMVILSNELPRLADSSGALASRFIVLALTRSFYGTENPSLTAELCEELSGIFHWSLDGIDRLQQRGRFQLPKASEDTIREIEDLSSPVGAFVSDHCVVGSAQTVPVDELYKAYCNWCEEHGRGKPSTQVFGRDLRALFPSVRMVRPRAASGDRHRAYEGIGLVRNGPRTEALYSPPDSGQDSEQYTGLDRGPSWTTTGKKVVL